MKNIFFFFFFFFFLGGGGFCAAYRIPANCLYSIGTEGLFWPMKKKEKEQFCVLIFATTKKSV